MKNYGNSNISPCKNIIFQKSCKRNQNPSTYYNSITNLKFQHKPKSLKLLYLIVNLNTISLPWQAQPTKHGKLHIDYIGCHPSNTQPLRVSWESIQNIYWTSKQVYPVLKPISRELGIFSRVIQHCLEYKVSSGVGLLYRVRLDMNLSTYQCRLILFSELAQVYVITQGINIFFKSNFQTCLFIFSCQNNTLNYLFMFIF